MTVRLPLPPSRLVPPRSPRLRPPPSPPAASSPPRPRTVQIERTAGIPHITAATYEGLAYGTAYAYAQDNVCQLANHLVTVRGERSLYFGATATGLLGLRTLPNAQIDLFIRSHMDDAALARAHATLGPAAQAAIRGYVAGYNRYLQDTGPARLPAECRGAPWVTPMTVADLSRVTEELMVLAGVGAGRCDSRGGAAEGSHHRQRGARHRDAAAGRGRAGALQHRPTR